MLRIDDARCLESQLIPKPGQGHAFQSKACGKKSTYASRENLNPSEEMRLINLRDLGGLGILWSEDDLGTG